VDAKANSFDTPIPKHTQGVKWTIHLCWPCRLLLYYMLLCNHTAQHRFKTCTLSMMIRPIVPPEKGTGAIVGICPSPRCCTATTFWLSACSASASIDDRDSSSCARGRCTHVLLCLQGLMVLTCGTAIGTERELGCTETPEYCLAVARTV
jgi:hypothetical protein